MTEQSRIVTAERLIAADAADIFELIADPAQQPRWDGNDNLVQAPDGQRVRAVGDVFEMVIHNGQGRENHVVEFEEPAAGGTLVRHTYDWTALTDESRLARARVTTADSLRASIDRLAALAER
jgi:hypothetical protein